MVAFCEWSVISRANLNLKNKLQVPFNQIFFVRQSISKTQTTCAKSRSHYNSPLIANTSFHCIERYMFVGYSYLLHVFCLDFCENVHKFFQHYLVNLSIEIQSYCLPFRANFINNQK